MASPRAAIKHLLFGFAAIAWISACEGDGSGSGASTTGEGDTETDTTTSSVKIGNGGGGAFQDGSASAELLAATIDDASWNVEVVVVDASNIAVTEVFSVTFSSTCVTTGLASFSESSVNTIAGRASTTYASGTCDGVDTVVASINAGGQTLSAQADLDIDSAVASAGGGTGASALSLGSGTGTGYTAGALGASATSLQAGASVTISANIVDSDNEPFVSPISVAFSSGCVSTGLASFGQTTVSTDGGLATTLYTAAGCSGEDTISATANYEGQVLNAEVLLDIAADTVLGVEFVSNSESTLAIAGIGGDETSLVTFRIVGAQGAPIVGELVSFELSNSAGGATLASETESGETNNSGEVTTVVQSGTVNSSLRVIATHDATGIQGFSDDISISTGVPVSRSFDLSLIPSNPHAWRVNDAEVSITANVSDQFGNAPPDGTRVSFRSVEIGIIPGSCELVNGECTVIWESSGNRGLITADTLGRGGRASVIGFMSGAEDFTDFNANGLFDSGSSAEVASITDLGEAFTDQNEDGVFNTGENFVDSFLNNPAPTSNTDGASNESYDASGDGIYNGPCSTLINSDCPVSALQSTTIWDEVVISLSSEDAQFCDIGNLPPVGTTIDAGFFMSGVYLCDINENSLPVGTVITFEPKDIELVGVTRYTVPSNTTEPAGPFGVVILAEGAVDAGASFTIRVAVPNTAEQAYTWLVDEAP
ncbi:MAG: hypothetical protein K6L81_15435 [Agarilytica sp.]